MTLHDMQNKSELQKLMGTDIDFRELSGKTKIKTKTKT